MPEPNLHIANQACACGMTLEPCPEIFVDVHVKVSDDDEYLGTAYCSAECAPPGTKLAVIVFG